jgi:hypothetical protein
MSQTPVSITVIPGVWIGSDLVEIDLGKNPSSPDLGRFSQCTAARSLPLHHVHHANSLPDLISSALGGKVLSFSDEWFAEASNLLTPTPPIRQPGKMVYSGAWYDGWETRRHNTAPFDYVVIRLGVASGTVESRSTLHSSPATTHLLSPSKAFSAPMMRKWLLGKGRRGVGNLFLAFRSVDRVSGLAGS